MFLGAVFWGSVFAVIQWLFYNPYSFTLKELSFFDMFMSLSLSIAVAAKFNVKKKENKYLHIFLFPTYGLVIGIFVIVIFKISGFYL